MNMDVGLHNEFDIVIRNGETGAIKQEVKSYNVILNQFWGQFISATNNIYCFNSIAFGSGTVAPLATDTGLTSLIAGKAATLVSTDLSTFWTDGIIRVKKTIRIEAGEQTGKTISEVGFCTSSTGSLMTTKSLLKDENGNPLSILIGATEVVDIYGTYYIKMPLLINGGKVLLGRFGSTVSDNYVSNLSKCILGTRAWGVNTGGVDTNCRYCKTKDMSALLFDGWGLSSNANTAYAMAYVPKSFDVANKKIIWTVPNMIAGNGNTPKGFRSLLIEDGLCIQLPQGGFAQPVIVKEVIAAGDGVTKDFATQFGCIMDNSTAKLYVGDIEVPATFDYEVPTLGTPDNYADHLKIISFTQDIKSGVDFKFPFVLENPYYSNHALASVYIGYCNLYASNDNAAWELVAGVAGAASKVTISAGYQKYRYWKFVPYAAGNTVAVSGFTCIAIATGNKVVHAVSSPANGATVTLTYQPNCIAKDENHIINNVAASITFNTYTPE